MAAPIRNSCFKFNVKRLLFDSKFMVQNEYACRYKTLRLPHSRDLNTQSFFRSSGKNSYASKFFKRSCFAAVTMTGGYVTYRIFRNLLQSHVAYAEDAVKRPDFKVSRSVSD